MVIIIAVLIFIYYISELIIKRKCNHEYELIHTIRLTDEDNVDIGAIFVQECKKCGKIKHYKIKG